MKKALVITSAVLLAIYCVAVATAIVTPLNPFGGGRWLVPGGDYMLRMNEIGCLKRGVNPFDVWHGDVVLKPYLPLSGEGRSAVLGKPGFTEQLHVYPPWEYAAMMPFSFLPVALSWTIYLLAMFAGLWLLFFAGRSFCRLFSGGGEGACAIASALSVLFVALPVFQNLLLGNFAVPVLVAAVLMAVCLNRGHDVLAGVCLAAAMLKPQLSLAFVIPLVMLRKFKTCTSAAAICAALAVIPALVCRASPLEMVLQGVSGNSFLFTGCGTMPSFLCPYLPGGFGIIVGLVIGAALCAYMTHRLASSGVRDWMVLLMPAAVMGAAWTYAQCFSFSMNWFFFLVLCSSLVKWPRSRFLWALAALSAVFMTRLYNLAHFLPKVLPGVVPEFLPSEAWHYHIDTIVSSVGIALTLALGIWISRRAAKEDMQRSFGNGS